MTYVALLRGINVGGNNKVSMAELKTCFEAAGLTNVRTYINSGNALFTSENSHKAALVTLCEASIEKHFGFKVLCAVITAEELKAALQHAPSWWDKSPEARHNALFVIAPRTAVEVINAVGPTDPQHELVAHHGPVIFWSTVITSMNQSRYKRILSLRVYKEVTIRNANTTKKLLELLKEH